MRQTNTILELSLVMSSHFKTVRSNRKWMIKSKAPPSSLSDCHLVFLSPFISSLLSQRLSFSVHPSLHQPLRTSSLLFINAVDGWGLSYVLRVFVFVESPHDKKRQSNSIIIIAGIIRNSSLFISSQTAV